MGRIRQASVIVAASVSVMFLASSCNTDTVDTLPIIRTCEAAAEATSTMTVKLANEIGYEAATEITCKDGKEVTVTRLPEDRWASLVAFDGEDIPTDCTLHEDRQFYIHDGENWVKARAVSCDQ